MKIFINLFLLITIVASFAPQKAQATATARTCLDIIIDIAEENEEILELGIDDIEEIADNVIHHIQIDPVNGQYHIERPLGRGTEVPPPFYRGDAPDLNLIYRRNTIESGISPHSRHYQLAQITHGHNRMGNPQVVVAGDTIEFPLPPNYLPNGRTSLSINVPQIIYTGDFHTRDRVINYLNDFLGYDYDLPPEGIQNLSHIDNVLGNGGLRIVLADPDNSNQVIKFYDPELIRAGNNITNLADFQEMIGKNIQKEILLYDILVAIEQTFVNAGYDAPFHITRMLNRNNPAELALGIFRYERSRGEIYRQINYFPGISRLVQAVDHEVFVMLAKRYHLVSTKGTYPDGSPRFVGYDLFSNIMVTSQYGRVPVIFDF